MVRNDKYILTSPEDITVFEFLITEGKSFIKRGNSIGPR